MNLKKKFILISKNKKIKFLLFTKKNYGGRNLFGKITLRHRGAKLKKKSRIIDNYKALWNIIGYVIKFEYDPNRNTSLYLIAYTHGIYSYNIAVEKINLQHKITNGIKIKKFLGCSFLLKNTSVGMKINNLEINLYSGAKLLRASGIFGKIIKKTRKTVLIKLKSGDLKKINKYCMITKGVVLNFNYYLKRYKKAGLLRIKGFKPHVRGVAMNPVDHPYGGGEGKKSKKSISMSPWGKLTKGKKTRKNKISII